MRSTRQLGTAFFAATLTIAACSGRAPAASPEAPADAAEFAVTLCTASDELFLAFGNPDAGVPSESWKAFEDAIDSGDVAALDRAGAAVLSHVEAGRAANRRGATFAPATAVNAELEALLVAIDTQVRTVLEARGDRSVAKAAEAAAGEVWQQRWPAWLSGYMRLARAGVVLPNIPCNGSVPAAS